MDCDFDGGLSRLEEAHMLAQDANWSVHEGWAKDAQDLRILARLEKGAARDRC